MGKTKIRSPGSWCWSAGAALECNLGSLPQSPLPETGTRAFTLNPHPPWPEALSAGRIAKASLEEIETEIIPGLVPVSPPASDSSEVLGLCCLVFIQGGADVDFWVYSRVQGLGMCNSCLGFHGLRSEVSRLGPGSGNLSKTQAAHPKQARPC